MQLGGASSVRPVGFALQQRSTSEGAPKSCPPPDTIRVELSGSANNRKAGMSDGFGEKSQLCWISGMKRSTPFPPAPRWIKVR